MIGGQLRWTRMEAGWYRATAPKGGLYEVARSMDDATSWCVQYGSAASWLELLPMGTGLPTLREAKQFAQSHSEGASPYGTP